MKAMTLNIDQKKINKSEHSLVLRSTRYTMIINKKPLILSLKIALDSQAHILMIQK